MKKLLITILIGFGVYGYIEKNPGVIPSFSEETDTSSQALTAAYEKRQSDEQVSGSGRVIRLLPDDNEGSRHQKFIIRVSSGRTLLIAHNIDLAPRINSIREGDTIEYFGEYEWNSKGGVIHWTHNDPNGRHEDGWLKHKGRIYQ
jgi:hypothetical protein